MTWPVAAAAAVLLLTGFAAGLAIGLLRGRTRLRRVADAAAELLAGNFTHRVLLPGDDEAARIAEALNATADSIQRQREAAAARDAAQRRLLANISHDLRTPITSIAGYVDALQRGLGDQPERYLAVIAGKTEELAQLTDDLFYEARIDAGDLRLQNTLIDLAEAVRRSLLGFEPQLAAMGARIDVRIPDEPLVVGGDPSAITRILSNFMSNVVRHGEGVTAFSVEMLESDGQCIVRLTNDGSRLPEDGVYVFDRGAVGSAGGAGLGLSIARELTERMGGTVSAENSDGGVTFTLSLPKASAWRVQGILKTPQVPVQRPLR